MGTKILDCTLRDGGHVNNAEFGKENIKKIIGALTSANIDFVELGFLRNGKFSGNQALFNDITEIYPLLPKNLNNTKFTIMIRPDWYDIKQLSESVGMINIIRFAFYYKDFELMKEYCKIAANKGYEFICNPVNIMGYSSKEMKELIKRINDIHPVQMTMVDTYGSMQIDDLYRIYETVENNLDKDISIGLHLHENRNLSFGIAQEFCKIKEENREAVIDASLLGMGRIPGNLCIEVLAEYFNETGKNLYDMDILYRIIGECIESIKAEHPWGYSPAYFITAKYKMHRSYAEYLLEKTDLQLVDINNILKNVDINKRSEFYLDYIEKQYVTYKEVKKNV